MTKIKPCPFCGGKADVTRYYESGEEIGSAIVCNNCGVSVHNVEADNVQDNVKAWNKRATSDLPNDIVTDFRDCRNELCLRCGSYKTAHLGSCDGCRWKH
jgi:Lar family restriction alleviation protein